MSLCSALSRQSMRRRDEIQLLVPLYGPPEGLFIAGEGVARGREGAKHWFFSPSSHLCSAFP